MKNQTNIKKSPLSISPQREKLWISSLEGGLRRVTIALCLIGATTVTAQQNLGVNQTNPTAKTHITNSESQHSLRVDDEASDATPFTVSESGQVGIMNNNPEVSLDINATDAVNMPNGTTAQRPATPTQGAMRYNSEVKSMEFFDGTNWVSLTPAGSMQMFGGVQVQIPSGWLVCDGAEVSRTDYAALFAAIGTNFGEGDGATTFHLPDLRGRFARGADNGAGNDPDAASRTASNIGGSTGDVVGSLQGDQFKSHTHAMRYKTGGSSGNATYAGTGNTGLAFRGGGSMTSNPNGIGNPMQGSGGSETRPKNVSVNYIIKY